VDPVAEEEVVCFEMGEVLPWPAVKPILSLVRAGAGAGAGAGEGVGGDVL